MTSHRTRLLLRTATALLSAAAGASMAADSYVCPAAFPAPALQLGSTPDGWATHAEDPAPLYSAEVFDGPPQQRASLRPGASSRNSSTWTFEGSYPQGIWLQCTYAEGALELTRRLPKVPAACVASYPKLSKGRPVSVTFVCH